MKRFFSFCVAVVLCSTAALGDEMKLPAPKIDGGPAVLKAIDQRQSARGDSFPVGVVSQEELATLLWAATGLSSERKGWTVPTAKGADPYCDVYVAGADGVSLYDSKKHALVKISDGDIRKGVGMQDFVGVAPIVLIFVVKDQNKYGEVLVGAMTQNVYLASQALDIGVRYVASLKPDVVRSALKLGDKDVPVCIMPIGRRN